MIYLKNANLLETYYVIDFPNANNTINRRKLYYLLEEQNVLDKNEI